MAPRIGVLALQGDFEAHQRALRRTGFPGSQVRRAEELAHLDGLIIPGGESTTMLKLLKEENLFEPLRDFGRRKPVFGTCAGAILMADKVLNPAQESLGLCDLTVERNAYGRQLDSSVARIETEGRLGREDRSELDAVFIRAPIIRSVGPCGAVLARYNGDPVLVEHGMHLVATFHPELTDDPRVHAYFVRKILVQVPS